MYLPPLLEELGLVELEHNPPGNRVNRAGPGRFVRPVGHAWGSAASPGTPATFRTE
jgi:hypothetical protein